MSGGCVGWPDSPNVVEAVSLAVLAASALLYSFAPLFGLDGPTQIWLEAITLAATVITGAVAGSVLGVWASKERSKRSSCIINYALVGTIPFLAWAYTILQHVDSGEFGVCEAIAKAATLAVLIWAGAMLAAKIGIQYRIRSPGDAAKASTDVRHTTKNTTTLLEDRLYYGAMITLAVVIAVVVVSIFKPVDQSTYLVKLDTLFTASATIMGLAAFGSALATLGKNKGTIKSIAYALLPVIAIQAAFMLSFVSDINFPAPVWIVMTAVWLFLLVFAMAANRILPVGTDGATNPAR